MVYTGYTKNLYSSEVYRELERRAIKKGFFNPTDEDIIKTASVKVSENKEVSTKPSGDLVQDIACLAYAMRRKGFQNQAQELEEKLVIYKQAESAYYNVTPEKNKDFIEFSHRDGDVEIVPGSGELGVIETIDSLARKIRDIAEKEPTGKAGFQELADFVKKADWQDEGGPGAGRTSQVEGLHPKVKGSVDRIKSQLKNISNAFSGIQAVNFDEAMTNFLHGQGGKSSVFGTLGGNYGILDNYGALYKLAYRGQPGTIQTIHDILVKYPQQANQYLQAMGINEKFANKIKNSLVKKAQFPLPLPLPVQPLKTVITPVVENLIKPPEPSKIDPQKDQLAWDIARRISTQIEIKKNAAQQEVNKVKKALSEKQKQAYLAAKALTTWAGYSINTLRDVRNFYLTVQKNLGQIQATLSEIGFILNGFGLQNYTAEAKQGIELLKDAVNDLGNNISVSGANIPDTEARLKNIYRKVYAITEREKDNVGAKRTLALINQMLAGIRENKAKGEKAVLEAIPGGYSSWNAFDADTIELEKKVDSELGGK